MDKELVSVLSEYAETAVNQSLAEYTGFRTGGRAEIAVFPDSKNSLAAVAALLNEKKQPYYILGQGTNVLAGDGGYDGVLVVTKNAGRIELCGDVIICESGALLRDVCAAAADAGLSGLEFACGIPGTVGGAVFMNAGAYGGEMSDAVELAETLGPNGGVNLYDNAECGFSYRHSRFQETKEVILSAKLRLRSGEKEKIMEKMRENLSSRTEKQPLEYPSCGSVFKRPAGNFAAKLIEESGLKGFRIGGAMVSDKHAGFIVNYDSAASADIYALIKTVRAKVLEQTGYELSPEIRILGRDSGGNEPWNEVLL